VIDFSAHDDELLLEDSARRFADEQLRPCERAHEATGCFPPELRARYEGLGLCDVLAQTSLAIAAIAWERLAAGDPAAPLALGPPRGVVVVVEQLATPFEVPWLPCARPTSLSIVAPQGVTRASDLIVEPLAAASCGLRAAGAARVTVRQPGKVIGDAADAARWLVDLRVFAAACMLGAARDAASYARLYARERTAFGRPIAHHQGLAFELVDAATELDAAGLLLGLAAASEEPAAVAHAHALVTETAQRVAERSLQALGGHGYLHDHPIEKRMRDIRALASLYGGAIASERDAVDHVLEAA